MKKFSYHVDSCNDPFHRAEFPLDSCSFHANNGTTWPRAAKVRSRGRLTGDTPCIRMKNLARFIFVHTYNRRGRWKEIAGVA